MKSIPIIVSALLVAHTLCSQTQKQRDLLPSSLGYENEYLPDSNTVVLFHFNELSGTTVSDASGNNNHGTASGTTIDTGKFGMGRVMSTEDSITIADSPSFDFSAAIGLTLECWIRPDSLVEGYIFCKMGPDEWSVTVTSSGGFSFALNSPSTYTVLGSSGTLNPGQWQHLAFEWEKASHRMSIYINGVQDTSVISNVNSIQNTAVPFVIGKPSVLPQSSFVGAIDEVRISKIARSTEKRLVSYYPFNGNTDDESGNGNHCTNIIGAQLTFDRFGNSNSAYRFDGSDMIKGTIGSSLVVSDFTMCAWVRVTGVGGHNPRIFAVGPSGFQGENYSLVMHNPSTRGTFYSNDLSPHDLKGNGLLDNSWHFMSATFQGNQVSMYFDGELDTTMSTTGVLQTLAGNLVKFGDSDNGLDHFDGDIDDSRIYNYALSQEEIDSLYHLGGWPMQQTTWQSTLTAFDDCDTLQLVFGQAPLATNCIDSLYGEAELPPVGPSGTFDARFMPPCIDVEGLLRDFRSDSLTEVRWVLKLQACSPPITVRWDTSSFPTGSMRLKDNLIGDFIDIDMRGQAEFVVPNGITELLIERTEEVCRTVATHAGWNMVSTPTKPLVNYITLFPDAVSHPFRYTPGGYVADDTLDPGVGYWVKFNGVHNYNLCGYTLIDKCVDVVAGWNMIGPFEDTVVVSTITSDPGGIIVSSFYHYFPPYEVVATLYPGQAYWVKVSQAGKVCFSDDSSYPPGRSAEGFSNEFPPPPPDGVQETKNIPVSFALDQNYPNPFNPNTTIRYALPTNSHVSLAVFDMLGRKVATLVDNPQDAGFKSVEFDGSNLASGVYYYRLQAGDFVQTRKLMLLK